VVDLLLCHTNKHPHEFLMLALKLGRPDILRVLLSGSSTISFFYRAFRAALQGRCPDCMAQILARASVIHIKNRLINELQDILPAVAQRATPATNCKLLCGAAVNELYGCVDTLLAVKTNINAVSTEIQYDHCAGILRNPMVAADRLCQKQYPATIVGLLLRSKADPNLHDPVTGNTLLHVQRAPDTTKLLLEAKATMYAHNHAGMTRRAFVCDYYE